MLRTNFPSGQCATCNIFNNVISVPIWRDQRLRACMHTRKNAAQVATGFFGFLALRALVPAGLRAVAGLMLVGVAAAAGATSSGPGRKYTRQPGESCDLFLTMQAVTRSTSGISGPQSRNASPLQAACSSWV